MMSSDRWIGSFSALYCAAAFSVIQSVNLKPTSAKCVSSVYPRLPLSVLYSNEENVKPAIALNAFQQHSDKIKKTALLKSARLLGSEVNKWWRNPFFHRLIVSGIDNKERISSHRSMMESCWRQEDCELLGSYGNCDCAGVVCFWTACGLHKF